MQIGWKEAMATMMMFCASSFVNEVQVQGYQALIKSTNLYCKREHQRLDTEQGLGFDWSRSKISVQPCPSPHPAACLAGVGLGAMLCSPASALASEDTVVKTQ